MDLIHAMELIHRAMDLINRAFGLDAHTRTFTEKLEMDAKMAYVCFSIMAWSMIIWVMFAVYHILRYRAVGADVGAGQEAEALALLRASNRNANSHASDGSTPLHLAAKQGHEALALALVRAGAVKDAKDNNGHTPLHLAAQHGHEALALALIAGPSFWGRLWATFPLFAQVLVAILFWRGLCVLADCLVMFFFFWVG